VRRELVGRTLDHRLAVRPWVHVLKTGRYRRRNFSAISIWTTLPSCTTSRIVPNSIRRRTLDHAEHDLALVLVEIVLALEAPTVLRLHVATTLESIPGRLTRPLRRGAAKRVHRCGRKWGTAREGRCQ
jgi:hypothetical protein